MSILQGVFLKCICEVFLSQPAFNFVQFFALIYEVFKVYLILESIYAVSLCLTNLSFREIDLEKYVIVCIVKKSSKFRYHLLYKSLDFR